MIQTEKILDYCKTHGSITPLEAMQELGIMRLAARIADLEKEGIIFIHEREASHNKYGDHVSYTRYKLQKGGAYK